MTTALYRRYRPETFEDVIGQSHVTEPLMTALRKNKVNHAYLFSGPRGCGKTTSARILARCLNCAQGPTPTPCGQCESCRDLARDGAGSLDVIEMDAASHGGVDDARQLRERATFAPVRDRYKIFIIDEAHMVTRDGFNALLKIVEEPPEHIKFIFATTEPNKVLPTIRSRTHHYPFRLVPPEPLMEYLSALCEQEGVGVEPGVQAMVVRAGGGSVRDSLSVLDQLMAGTDQDEISYDLASSLLGYTHGALLDDVVDAFASGDAATVFRAVDRVIQTGQDPRRFVEDLLERFRDLVIVDAVPENAGNILHGTPEDQISRLRNQAQQMGASELSRAADITNEALTEMVGATSPQLHLELLCARLLLPSAENTTRGVGVRVDRLERRLNIGRTGAPTGPLLDVPAQQPAERSAPEPTQHADASSSWAAQSGQADDGPASSAASRQEAQGTGGASGTSDAPDSPDERPEPAAQDGSGWSQQPRAPEEDPDPLSVAQGGFGKFRGSSPEQPGGSDRGPASMPERSAPEQPAPEHSGRDRSAQQPSEPSQPGTRTPDQTPQRPPHADASAAQGPASGGEIDMIRNSWTEIISALAEIHRVSWMTAMRGTPIAFDGSVLQLMFESEGDRKNFPRFEPNLVQAIQQVIGVSCRVEAVGPGGAGSRGDSGPSPRGGGPRGSGPRDPGPRDAEPRGGGPRGGGPRRSGPGDGDPRDAGPREPGSRGGPEQSGSHDGQTPRAGSDGPASAAAQQQPTQGPQGDGSLSRGDIEHDGGRATGPRPFPPRDAEDAPSQSAPSAPSAADDRRAPRGEQERQSEQGPAPDDSAEVTSWEVASIPTSDPMASAPAGPDAPAQDAPEPGAGDAMPPQAPDAALPADGAAPRSPAGVSSPGDDARPTDDATPGVTAPVGVAAPVEEAAPLEEAAPEPSRPGAAEHPRPEPRERIASQRPPRRSASARRGEDPSPDPVVPASPYDDIPWPDEAPPEEEPPFEDPGYRSAPSRREAARAEPAPQHDPGPAPDSGHVPASGPAPASGPSAASGSAPSSGPAPAPGPSAASGSAPTPQHGTQAEAPRQDRAAQQSPAEEPTGEPAEEEAPPEQWRPSTPGPTDAASSAAPVGGAGTAPSQAPGAPRKQSFRERHAAHFAAAQQDPTPRSAAMSAPDLDSEATFSPSEDDEAVENTDQSTRALIERILGGRLVEEIPHQPGM